LSATTLDEVAEDLAKDQNIEELKGLSLLERHLLQVLEAEYAKWNQTPHKEEPWAKNFSTKEDLALRLLWQVAKLRGGQRREDPNRPIDSILWGFSDRIVNHHKVPGEPLQCKAFAGLCKLDSQRGRAIMGVLCLDLMLVSLAKSDKPVRQRPGRARHVLECLRALSLAYPGLLSYHREDEYHERKEKGKGKDGMDVLSRTVSLLATEHTTKQAEKGTKKKDRWSAEDCRADIARENGWSESESLKDLLAGIVRDFDSLPAHDAKRPYSLEPHAFVGLKCLELLALWKGWIWTFNELIVDHLWPLLRTRTTNSSLAVAVRATGHLMKAVTQFLTEPLPLQGSEFLINTLADLLSMDPMTDSTIGAFSVKLSAAQAITDMASSLSPSVRSWVHSLPPARVAMLPPALRSIIV